MAYNWKSQFDQSTETPFGWPAPQPWANRWVSPFVSIPCGHDSLAILGSPRVLKPALECYLYKQWLAPSRKGIIFPLQQRLYLHPSSTTSIHPSSSVSVHPSSTTSVYPKFHNALRKHRHHCPSPLMFGRRDRSDGFGDLEGWCQLLSSWVSGNLHIIL